ncbi:MAG: glutaminyl-peptide cyclotransferase [Kiritimatiellae bacterium]|nr:glutaminyl-peptide cyclotransferase [Kiritimatiellia bacterium]MDW8458484.1 glutaminyl-peptide cyclotransferase [Verrucomicrobiota bacterium]
MHQSRVHYRRRSLPWCLLRLTVIAVASLALSGAFAEQREKTAALEFRILRTLPHDPTAFTQGLLFWNGRLIESTGLYGESSLREVDLDTGAVIRRRNLPSVFFGEGIALWSNRIFQLTWREKMMFVYNAETFETLGSYPWDGEGWGLTVWSNRLVASDGSEVLRFYDPQTMKSLGSVIVRDGDSPLRRLNELEAVGPEIFANVWGESRVARIDPATGQVLGWLDFSPLLPEESRLSRENVLNGIAYNEATRRLFVTGKRWSVLYELELIFPKR